MKKIDRKFWFGGFTLIELLVVISIIGLLLGILVPGMKVVKRQARNLRQKACMRDIEVGLEYFRSDHGSFPRSKKRGPGTSLVVSGAQHLAEALVGRDTHGFEPSSQWYALTDQVADTTLYDWSDSASKNRRDEVSIELKDMRAVTLSELYADASNPTVGTCYSGTWDDKPAPVLIDIFQHKQVTLKIGPDEEKQIRAGSPILYYRAKSGSKIFRDPTNMSYQQWIYNHEDNDEILKLGSLIEGEDGSGSTKPHLFASDAPGGNGKDDFYEFITNKEQTRMAGSRPFYKPFNATEYIIISAGWDGIFGTKDDLTNFNY